MKYLNYINIDTNNLQKNIKNFKRQYKYKYYIFNVSNNAFSLGYNIIKNLTNIDYLYANNLFDIYNIRKINKDIPIIFEGLISNDNILDLINQNVILIINNLNSLKNIENNLFDNLNIILNIDINGFNGLKTKEEIKESLDIIKNIKKLNLLGIKSESLKTSDLSKLNYIINDLLMKNLKLFILNDEENLIPFKNSNAIKLDYSLYGMKKYKTTIFKKREQEYLQIFSVYSQITQINKITKHKKIKYIASIPYGYLNGMSLFIKKVIINKNFYNITAVNDSYTLIEVNDNININDSVEITSSNNPLDNYISSNPLLYLQLLNINLPIYLNNKKEIYI